MAFKDDLKSLDSLVQTMDTQLEMLTDLMDGSLTNTYGFDLSIKDKISSLTEDQIDNMSGDEISEILSKYADDTLEESFDESQPFDDYVKSVFKDIKSNIDQANDMQKQRDEIMKQINEATDNYFNYINSSEYKEKKLQKLQELREKAENEENILEKNKIIRMLDSMENADSLNFLFKRINDIGQKEIKSICDTYFNSNRSTIIMDKFHSRLPKYGFNDDVYKMFFNLEEKFLPEEYHDLNNIFLFHVMRFISYTNTESKSDALYVSSILAKLYNLIYHRFPDQEEENKFIDIIRKIDDNFLCYIDKFKKSNTTSPNHPARIQKDKEYDEKRRIMIITSLQNESIEPDTNLSTEELRQMLQDVIDKKNNEALQEQETSKDVPIEDHTKDEDIIDEVHDDDNNTEVYMDKYNCFYIKKEDNTYLYYDSEQNEVIEDSVPEDTILQLLSVDELHKEIISLNNVIIDKIN